MTYHELELAKMFDLLAKRREEEAKILRKMAYRFRQLAEPKI